MEGGRKGGREGRREGGKEGLLIERWKEEMRKGGKVRGKEGG